MGKKIINVRPATISVLLWGIAILVLMNVLTRFGVFDFALFTPSTITLIGAVSLLFEVGFIQSLRRGRFKMKPLDWVIALVGAFALLSVVFGYFGVSLGFLNNFQGVADVGLLVFIFIEIFRKN